VGRGKRLISSIYWLMSCSDCSDMVIVWKKRSKKNDKISRKEGSRGHWKEKERESIDVKGLKNNSNWNKKKVVQKIFLEIIIFENTYQKKSKGTQTVRILLVRYDC
jgi:hypothetical protein